MLSGPSRPLKSQATGGLGHRQLLCVVSYSFKGALVTESFLGIVGERWKTMDLLEDAFMEMGGFDALESADGLVVLGGDAHHLFGSVVVSRKCTTLDGVDQIAPVMLLEIQDSLCSRAIGFEILSLGQPWLVALSGRFVWSELSIDDWECLQGGLRSLAGPRHSVLLTSVIGLRGK